MRVGVIIFARMSSSRLPGKSLMDVGGRSLLGHVLDRSRRIASADEVVIATSREPSDDDIERFAEAEGVSCYRGDLEDVAGRALACAEHFGFDCFVRVCGDRPFFDPDLVDELVAWMTDPQLDLATNTQHKTFPPGLTAEIVRTSALRKALEQTDDPQDREHVTRYFYANAERFSLRNLAASQDWTDISLVIDDEADLDRARYIARNLPKPAQASVETIIDLARAWYANNATQG